MKVRTNLYQFQQIYLFNLLRPTLKQDVKTKQNAGICNVSNNLHDNDPEQ